jgi:hypothetical protein
MSAIPFCDDERNLYLFAGENGRCTSSGYFDLGESSATRRNKFEGAFVTVADNEARYLSRSSVRAMLQRSSRIRERSARMRAISISILDGPFKRAERLSFLETPREAPTFDSADQRDEEIPPKRPFNDKNSVARKIRRAVN